MLTWNATPEAQGSRCRAHDHSQGSVGSHQDLKVAPSDVTTTSDARHARTKPPFRFGSAHVQSTRRYPEERGRQLEHRKSQCHAQEHQQRKRQESKLHTTYKHCCHINRYNLIAPPTITWAEGTGTLDFIADDGRLITIGKQAVCTLTIKYLNLQRYSAKPLHTLLNSQGLSEEMKLLLGRS